LVESGKGELSRRINAFAVIPDAALRRSGIQSRKKIHPGWIPGSRLRRAPE
jgi:hypothetical protein